MAIDKKQSTQTYKIGILCDDTLDKPDGVQQYVVILGRWLEARGHDVHYLTSTTVRTDLRNVHSLSSNISARFNGNRNNMPLPASPNRIKAFMAARQFDIVHIQMPYSPLLAGQVIHYAGLHTAVVGTFHVFPHSALMSVGTKALGLAVHFQLKRFQEVIATSEAAASFAQESFGIPTTVIPNMLSLEQFTSKRPAKPHARDTVRIVFLGRLVERKGVGHLLRAVEYLRRNYKTVQDWEVIVGGKGPLFAELDQYVQTHNLQDKVRFTGFVAEDEKAQFLADADIAVFPSTGGESFGISVVEGLAAVHGVVLAGDNPGYRSVMHGSKNQLVDPNDTPSFAHILASYIDDPRRRKAAYAWQSKHVMQFDTDVVAPRVLEVYERALQKQRN